MFGFVDNVQVDLVVNGRPQGQVGERLARVSYDPGLMRPMIMEDGYRCCWVANGKQRVENGKPVFNAAGHPVPDREPIELARLVNSGLCPPIYNTSALPYQAWQRIDTAVTRASRDRLQAWNDLAAANTYGGFNGMAVTALIKDTMTDPGDAKVDMDKMTDDLNDSSTFTPDVLPLPIIHAGFSLGPRLLAMARNAGMPLDTSNAESCGRRCAETLEKMTIGIVDYSGLTMDPNSQFTNAGIYGFRTQPDRITKTDLTASASFVPSTFVDEVIAMKELARAQNFYGPFKLYYSTTWDQYMARDYYKQVTAVGVIAPTGTVLQRVQQIAGITGVQMLDYFTNTDELLLVQMNAEVVRAVDGMDWTPVQYDIPGGNGMVYRVMGIKVPDLRSQYVGTSTSTRKCGIVHATTS